MSKKIIGVVSVLALALSAGTSFAHGPAPVVPTPDYQQDSSVKSLGPVQALTNAKIKVIDQSVIKTTGVGSINSNDGEFTNVNGVTLKQTSYAETTGLTTATTNLTADKLAGGVTGSGSASGTGYGVAATVAVDFDSKTHVETAAIGAQGGNSVKVTSAKN